MALFPLFVDLTGRSCLVVGGGTVATRRAKALLEFSAVVQVVAPELSPELASLAAAANISHCPRAFVDADLQGVDLVVAATSDAELNHRIVAMAIAGGILANDANSSSPAWGGFAFPGVVRENEVVVGISSSGSDPGLTRRIRQAIDASRR